MTIYEQLKAAGVETSHHESDLYARITPDSRAIIDAWEFRSNVTTFTADDGSGRWFELPFAYDPAWERG